MCQYLVKLYILRWLTFYGNFTWRFGLAVRLLRLFSRLGQCDNRPGYKAYCYAELAVSSLAVVVTIRRQYSLRLPTKGWSG